MMATGGIESVRRWDVVDEHGRRASLLIGHTREGQVAIATAAGPDDPVFVLLEPWLQRRFDLALHAATDNALRRGES